MLVLALAAWTCSAAERYDFTYPNRASLVAAGWSYVATTASGQPRNTEQTSGVVVSYNQALHPGALRIPADHGDLWAGLNDTRNTLFRSLPSNWSRLTLRLSFSPTMPYQQAGLLAYQDDDNYVQIYRAFNYANGGNGVFFASEQGGSAVDLGVASLPLSDVYLRLERDLLTEEVTGSVSQNGTNWTVVARTFQALESPRLAIVVGASPSGFPLADLFWAEVETSQAPSVSSLQSLPNSLVFKMTHGSTAPSPQTFHVLSRKSTESSFTQSDNASWLSLSATSGTTPAATIASVNPVGLAPGVYQAVITASAGASEPALLTPVTLIVNPAIPVRVSTWKEGKKGAVSVTVDDGDPSCFTELTRNSLTGTYYVNGITPPSFYGTYRAAGMEFASHLAEHPCWEIPTTELRDLMETNIQALCNPNTPEACSSIAFLAWPCGLTNLRYKGVASDHFLSARGYNINQLEDTTPADFFNLKSFNSHEHTPFPPADLKITIDQAEAQGKWANLVFHQFCNDNGAIDYAAQKDVWVAPDGSIVKYILQRDRAIFSGFQQAAGMIRFDVSRSAVPSSPLKSFNAAFGASDPVTLIVNVPQGANVSGVNVSGASAPFTLRALASGVELLVNVVIGETPKTVQVLLTAPDPLPSIMTSTLPDGRVSTPYAAALAASGGTPPYSWSLASGNLPAGLSLSPAGTIAGTPLAFGPSSFTVRVTDASSQTATKLLALTIVPNDWSTWPPTATPAIIDVGPEPAVELGVKFRAYSTGFLKGIRFYKSAGNVGPHTASLWTKSGQLLAQALFTAETASGWQQVLFASPVPIAANTVYIASYHTTVGHFSLDLNYFSNGAQDNGVIRFLAAGDDGPNGVYSYSTTPAFPTTSNLSSNYWVDVVFEPGAVPLSVGVSSVPNAPKGQPYSTTLLAVGGAPPYSWSLASGSLPSGLTLSAAGVISGTPTATGTWPFTVRVTDSTPQSVTKALSLTVPANEWTGVPPDQTPQEVDAGAEPAVELGVKFRTHHDGFIKAIRFYKAASNTGPHTGSLWSTSGQLLGQAIFTSETASGWQQVAFPSPIPVAANTTYIASYHTTVGHFSVNRQYFATSATDNGMIRMLANGEDGPNGVYQYSETSTFPATSFNPSYYWVDVVFEPGAVPLSISNASLPDAPKGQPYSTTLQAVAGVAPYSWSLASGSLPSGLTLSAAGVISGTPTATGTWPFTVRVTDSTPQSVTKALSLIVPANEWTGVPPDQTPQEVDAGAEPPVELGVKFRTHHDGFIKAIRFYKAASNTGPHTGSVWSTSGQLLGQAIFASETASGWQQVAFTSPIPVIADTTYIASYHTTVGHFSVNRQHFATSATDNGMIRMLANGEDGPNGVYQYSETSTFPATSFNPSYYWVDVVFEPGAVPHRISGTITGGGGSIVSLSGAATRTATADASGNYSFPDLSDGSYVVTPTKPGFVFTPASRTIVLSGADLSGINFSATGVPIASLTPASLAFGSRLVGTTSAAQTATLSNSGGGALTISSISITGTHATNFARTTTCGSSLAAGASCVISVTFTPSTTGVRSATLSVVTNAAGSPHAVALGGTGTAAVAGLSSSSLSFGNQLVNTTSPAQTVTLSNTGSAPLTISSITRTGSHASNFAHTTTCGSTVAQGANCTISVTFTPSAGGARSASLVISSNATGSPASVSLAGIGTQASVTPTALAFGSRRILTTSSAQVVTLRNLGSTSLTGITSTVTGGNASDFTRTTTCGSTLAAGATCTISVTFRPMGIGARSSTLRITHSDPTSPQSVTVSGTGTLL